MAYAPISPAGSEDVPDEIQVLRIANRAAFDRFMTDPDRVTMADERNSVIGRTEVFVSGEVVDYA